MSSLFVFVNFLLVLTASVSSIALPRSQIFTSSVTHPGCRCAGGTRDCSCRIMVHHEIPRGKPKKNVNWFVKYPFIVCKCIYIYVYDVLYLYYVSYTIYIITTSCTHITFYIESDRDSKQTTFGQSLRKFTRPQEGSA